MRKILLIFFLIMTLGWLSSCEIESSSKGNLYGFWHLVSIDSLYSDTPQGNVDYSQKLLFWAFQVHLVELMDQNQEHSPIVCRFEREGDSLFFDTPYYLDRAAGDPPVTELERMNYYGLNSMTPRMLIESLSQNKLVIKTDVVRLRFRKL